MANFTFEDQGNQIVLLDSTIGEQVGEIAFLESENTLIIVHTGVEPNYRHQGLAEQLVFQVVEKARQEGKKIFPICPFAKKEFDEKADYADVLQVDD
ncbi:N-acetyltransferase [Lactococcus hodotermopsidis]|uniref:N-acetyltransferase n=1 Tax=Pseudolactococcus hodotermopsidis TaxID=2709157 RepID=A0A6A0BFI6_9LACT|nr:GNAT family N-acetyltransferase [Lactococcus hodotermopsidis]GFH43041.1 N-acetyltransferase [Lactococcus hodotermopsidis]